MVKRFWEIDFFRGIAIILMVVFHLLWDLNHFNYINLKLFENEMFVFRMITVSIFLLIVGISLTLNKRKNYLDIFLQGLKIIGAGMIVTIATFFIFDNFYVRFGILHLIGLGVILLYPFSRLNKYYSLVLGLGMIFIGNLITKINFSHNYFYVLGMKKASLISVDYYPLLPWLGVILLGVFLGKVMYKNNKRNFKVWKINDIKLIKFVGFLGRHSLIIYLLHQVVLFGGFWVFS